MSQPIISLICAMAKQRVIGYNNQMPWHLPADLKHFKATTMGKPIIMGRKTFESIGKALPGRRNLVVSRNKDFHAKDADVVSSIDEALSLLSDVDEIMVIGGANIYQQTLAMAQRLYLTFIDLEVEGDAFFPDYSYLNLKEVSRHSCAADENNPYAYTFANYHIGN